MLVTSRCRTGLAFLSWQSFRESHRRRRSCSSCSSSEDHALLGDARVQSVFSIFQLSLRYVLPLALQRVISLPLRFYPLTRSLFFLPLLLLFFNRVFHRHFLLPHLPGFSLPTSLRASFSLSLRHFILSDVSPLRLTVQPRLLWYQGPGGVGSLGDDAGAPHRDQRPVLWIAPVADRSARYPTTSRTTRWPMLSTHFGMRGKNCLLE